MKLYLGPLLVLASLMSLLIANGMAEDRLPEMTVVTNLESCVVHHVKLPNRYDGLGHPLFGVNLPGDVFLHTSKASGRMVMLYGEESSSYTYIGGINRDHSHQSTLLDYVIEGECLYVLTREHSASYSKVHLESRNEMLSVFWLEDPSCIHRHVFSLEPGDSRALVRINNGVACNGREWRFQGKTPQSVPPKEERHFEETSTLHSRNIPAQEPATSGIVSWRTAFVVQTLLLLGVLLVVRAKRRITTE